MTRFTRLALTNALAFLATFALAWVVCPAAVGAFLGVGL
jgi:hypothetical protein